VKILVAEDDYALADILRETLDCCGCNVDVAHDGMKALSFLRTEQYELVFLDHNMPEMTGVELLKYIKENDIKTKTVMMSGYPNMKEFLAKAVGADEYLNKPYSVDQIRSLVEKYRDNPHES